MLYQRISIISTQLFVKKARQWHKDKTSVILLTNMYKKKYLQFIKFPAKDDQMKTICE